MKRIIIISVLLSFLASQAMMVIVQMETAELITTDLKQESENNPLELTEDWEEDEKLNQEHLFSEIEERTNHTKTQFAYDLISNLFKENSLRPPRLS